MINKLIIKRYIDEKKAISKKVNTLYNNMFKTKKYIITIELKATSKENAIYQINKKKLKIITCST